MEKQKLEELKGYRKILYNIDMLNDFAKFGGSLYDPRIETAIPEQLKLLRKFMNEQQAIAFIKDAHTLDSLEIKSKSFPPHTIIGTTGAAVIDELKPFEEGSLIYPKNSTDAMAAPNVRKDIRTMTNLIEVVGSGCCTDICVLNFLLSLKNELNQNNRDVAVFAVKKAIETYHIPNIHDRDFYTNAAYALMQQAGIILVENTEELEEQEKRRGLFIERRGK